MLDVPGTELRHARVIMRPPRPKERTWMEMASRAELVRGVPLTLLSTSGTLRLQDGRLSFTRTRGTEVFDVPAQELHSVAISAMGLTVWHDRQRYRFAIGNRHTNVPVNGPVGAVIALAEMPAAVAEYRAGRDLTRAWFDTLSPFAAEPPDGLQVRAPWPLWVWAVSILAATLVLISIIALVVFASST
jgi:hypothetical protein